MRRKFGFLYFLIISLLYPAGVYQLAQAQHRPTVDYTPQVASAVDIKNQPEIVQLINEFRVANGVSELIVDKNLSELASIRAKDMVDRQYYSHISPEGQNFADLLSVVGLRSTLPSCENLTLLSNNDTSKQIVQSWITSDSHRECMINQDYSRVGVITFAFDEDRTLTVAIFSSLR